MKVQMDKKYRMSNGIEIRRILCVDRQHDDHCVIVEDIRGILRGFKSDGTDRYGVYLIEVSEYDDFNIDEPVMVRDHADEPWLRRYFAGVAPNGQPKAWAKGKTSWTADGLTKFIRWNQCRRPTAVEMDSQLEVCHEEK